MGIFSGITTAIGGIAGFLIGGPTGAAVGASFSILLGFSIGFIGFYSTPIFACIGAVLTVLSFILISPDCNSS